MICIKNGKYGAVYVPEEEKRPKETRKPAGDNALDALKEDIARIRDEMIKKNRDDLDAMYNIDMDNMSSSMKKLFASWTDGVSNALASVETIANSQEAVVKLVAQYDNSIASIEAKANKNSASINSIVQWQSDVDDSIKSTAAIQQEVSENSASIKQLVEVVGEDGEVLQASITTAILNDESFIELVADRVTISGTAEFVTRDELGDDDGSTVIAGNLITMNMDGTLDNGRTELDSKSKLRFRYQMGSITRSFANIYTNVDGSDSDVTSRYALVIQTDPFTNNYGSTARPAIKINAYGNISLESDNGSIYSGSTYGYILQDAGFGTRIRAESNFYNMVSNGIASSSYDYVFASDGIYYGTRKILST